MSKWIAAAVVTILLVWLADTNIKLCQSNAKLELERNTTAHLKAKVLNLTKEIYRNERLHRSGLQR
jgi:hypothetical protein